MPAEIQISLDSRNLARFRRLMQANSLVAAQSLTFTAQKAQDAWRAGNHSAFHMRRSWIDKGVRIRAATPGRLIATVGTIDRWMGRHIKGVGQSKHSSGKGLFVPLQPVVEQGTHTQIRARLRQMMGTKTKPFWWNGELLRRTGKGRSPLKVLAVLRNSVHIEPRLDAERIVDWTVQEVYPTVYARLLTKWAREQGAR